MIDERDITSVKLVEVEEGNITKAGEDQDALQKEEEKLHTKKRIVIPFMAMMILGAAQVGFALASANQLATLLNVKYGWDTDSEQALWQSLVGSSIVVGLSVGACIGGKVIIIGRRKTMLIMNVVGMVGVAITMIENEWMLLLGRVIYGFAVGIESVCMPRYLEELLPLRLYGVGIATYASMINIGNVVALCSAVILPPDTDTEALREDNLDWRIIFAIPGFWFLLQQLGFIFWIKHDGPTFHLCAKRYYEARASFKVIYHTNGDEKHFDALVREFEKSAKVTSSTTVSLKDAIWSNENYVRASWVNITNIIFHELSGINVIMQYSNTILEQILGDDTDGGFNAKTGTYLISLTNWLAALASIYTINAFGRRTLLILGHSGMTVAHALIGVFIIIDFNLGVILGICVFLVIYQNSSGPIAYQYATETCCDIALGMCILAIYISVLILSLITEPLMNSPLQSQGVFFLFSGLSLIAVAFLYFRLGETLGLSRAEKKALYVPGGQWGRPLRPNEQAYSPFAVQRGRYSLVKSDLQLNRTTVTDSQTSPSMRNTEIEK